jgi:hypothetical protein
MMSTEEHTWTNRHGETLRLEFEEDGKVVLYHSDFDNVPVVLDIHVVGYRRDLPDPLEGGRLTSEGMIRKATGDVVLSGEEQMWLLGQMMANELAH